MQGVSETETSVVGQISHSGEDPKSVDAVSVLNGSCPPALTAAEAAANWVTEGGRNRLAHASGAGAPTSESGQHVTMRHLDGASLSESRLAEMFIDRHGDEMRYVSTWGKWMCWNGLRWQPESTLLAFDRAHAVAREAAS